MRNILLAAAFLAVSSVSAGAATCSHWRKVCEQRAGGAACDAKFAKCMSTGTWKEGDAYGGKTHVGLTKK